MCHTKLNVGCVSNFLETRPLVFQSVFLLHTESNDYVCTLVSSIACTTAFHCEGCSLLPPLPTPRELTLRVRVPGQHTD